MAGIGVVSYDASSLPVREDIVLADQRAWNRLSRPGAWWSGAQRVSIAAEARHADDCGLCEQLRSELTPEAVSGEHENLGYLPGTVVEVIHRICESSRNFPAHGESWGIGQAEKTKGGTNSRKRYHGFTVPLSCPASPDLCCVF